MKYLNQSIPYPEFTVAERDAYVISNSPPINFIIKNTTYNRLEKWNGAIWNEIHNPSLRTDYETQKDLANSNELTFYDTTKEILEIASGSLSNVESFTEAYARYSTTHFGDPYAILYLRGYLYIGTRQMPARLAKINATDFTDSTIITFPGSNALSLYSIIETLTYSNHTDRIYASFSDPLYDGRKIKVVEINPEDLSYIDVITETAASYMAGFCKSIAKDDKLYVVTAYGAKKVVEYSLDTYSIIREIPIPITGSEVVSSIAIDSGSLYIAEVNGDAALKKLDLDTFTFTQNQALPSNALANNLVVVGDYIWTSSLNSLASGGNTTRGIYRINKNDFSDYIQLYVENTEDAFGMLYDGKYLWCPIKTSPVKLLRINPNTFEINSITLPAGENKFNKLATDGVSLFFTSFENPCKLIKLQDTFRYDETYFADSNFGVSLKIDHISGSIFIGGNEFDISTPDNNDIIAFNNSTQKWETTTIEAITGFNKGFVIAMAAAL